MNRHGRIISASLLLLLCTVANQPQRIHAATDNTATTPPIFFLSPNHNAASGPIEDATCDVEQIEQANDSQLHVILRELMTTSFFRSFAVDLDQTCPLTQWNKKKKVKDSGQHFWAFSGIS
jgi:hypothetical protein